MRRAPGPIASCAAAAVWATVAWAAEPVHVLQLGERSVSIPWSATWQERTATAPVDPRTAAFGTSDKLKLEVLLTAGPPGAGEPSDQAMESMVADMVGELSKQSVEKELPVQRISTSSAHGYYVCATDRAPKPDEYKYVCQGMLSSGGAAFMFMVLYNENGKTEAEKAVTALKSLQLSSQS